MQYVKPGQKLLPPSASFHNALVSVIKRRENLRRGFINEDQFNISYNQKQILPVKVKAHADVDRYGVLTFDPQSTYAAWDAVVPQFDSQYPDASETSVFVTNTELDMISGNAYMCELIGFSFPRKVRYEDSGGTPYLGALMQPSGSSDTVKVGSDTFIAVSEPSTDEELIWILRNSTAGSFYIIRFKIESVNNYVATVTITSRPCNVSSVPEEVGDQVDVYDPCQVFFDEPDADLVGRCGGAWYCDPTGQVATGTGTFDTEATGTGTGTTACRWEVFWLGCPDC
jgi:hypothetical protein